MTDQSLRALERRYLATESDDDLRAWVGACLQLQLRMPRRGPDDTTLEEGEDVLPSQLRRELLGFFLGYVEAYASAVPLSDFARAYPYGEVRGHRYGVRDGVPFDEGADVDALDPPIRPGGGWP